MAEVFTRPGSDFTVEAVVEHGTTTPTSGRSVRVFARAADIPPAADLPGKAPDFGLGPGSDTRFESNLVRS